MYKSISARVTNVQQKYESLVLTSQKSKYRYSTLFNEVYQTNKKYDKNIVSDIIIQRIHVDVIYPDTKKLVTVNVYHVQEDLMNENILRLSN